MGIAVFFASLRHKITSLTLYNLIYFSLKSIDKMDLNTSFRGHFKHFIELNFILTSVLYDNTYLDTNNTI